MAKVSALEYVECKTRTAIYDEDSGTTSWGGWGISGRTRYGYIGISKGYRLEGPSDATVWYTEYYYSTSCIHFKTPIFDGKSQTLSITIPFKSIESYTSVKVYISLSTSSFDNAYTHLTKDGTPTYANLTDTIYCKLYNISNISNSISLKTLTIDCEALESDTDYYLYFSPYGVLNDEYLGAAELKDVSSQTHGTITYTPPFGAVQLFQGSSATPYLPHIFVDGEWKQCSPCVYSDGAWHECER